jgi:hypothetical protein
VNYQAVVRHCETGCEIKEDLVEVIIEGADLTMLRIQRLLMFLLLALRLIR